MAIFLSILALSASFFAVYYCQKVSKSVKTSAFLLSKKEVLEGRLEELYRNIEIVKAVDASQSKKDTGLPLVELIRRDLKKIHSTTSDTFSLIKHYLDEPTVGVLQERKKLAGKLLNEIEGFSHLNAETAVNLFINALSGEIEDELRRVVVAIQDQNATL